jgi:hypothetical protein
MECMMMMLMMSLFVAGVCVCVHMTWSTQVNRWWSVFTVEKTKMRLACSEVLASFQPERSCSAHISCSCRLFVTWHGMTDRKFSGARAAHE